MATLDLDTNQWYYLYVNGDKSNALLGTDLYVKPEKTSGAVFFNKTDISANTMRWQIYPINSTTYVLRSKEGGANAFIGTHYVAAEETEGNTRPRMVRGDIADDSVFWQFGSWGDDTWKLWNMQNGTGYQLNCKQSFILAMSPNITAPQNGQRWGFQSIAKIDDKAYSSVNLLGATVTSPGASAITTSTGTSSPTPTSSTSPLSSATSTPSTGLSTAAKAGIGAAFGAAALIALVVLGLFYRRKRNRNRVSKPQGLAFEPYQGQDGGEVAPALPERRVEHYKHELYHDDSAAKHEMPGQTVTEVDARGQERPAELMGDIERR